MTWRGMLSSLGELERLPCSSSHLKANFINISVRWSESQAHTHTHTHSRSSHQMLGTAWLCRKSHLRAPAVIKTACLFDLSNPAEIWRNLSLCLSHWSHIRGVSQAEPITWYSVNYSPLWDELPIHWGDLLETSWPLLLWTNLKGQWWFCPPSLIKNKQTKKRSTKQCSKRREVFYFTGLTSRMFVWWCTKGENFASSLIFLGYEKVSEKEWVEMMKHIFPTFFIQIYNKP